MSSTFTCPHCGVASQIEPAHVGKTGPCRSCGKDVTIPFPKEASLPPTATSRGSSTPWIIGCAVIAVVGLIVLGLVACAGLAMFSFRSQQMQMQEQVIRAERAQETAIQTEAAAQALADEAEKVGAEMEKAGDELEKKATEAAAPSSNP